MAVVTCRLCRGPCDAPVVARWEMHYPLDPPSQNETQDGARNHRWKRALHKKRRDEACTWARAEKRRLGIPDAAAPRIVIFERLILPRQRRYDGGNFIGGVKFLLDALRMERLLVQDSPRWVLDYYHQVPGNYPGVIVTIEELVRT